MKSFEISIKYPIYCLYFSALCVLTAALFSIVFVLSLLIRSFSITQ